MLAVSESIANSFTKLDIGVMNRIECDQIHLLHIRFAVFGQILFVTENIDDFCYQIVASLTLVFCILSGVFLPLAMPT